MPDHPALLPGEEFEIDLRALVARLRKAWLLIVLAGCLGAGLAAAWGWWKGPLYIAKMQILETGARDVGALGGLSSLKSLVGQSTSDELGSLELFRALLGSRVVAERVLRKSVKDPRTDSTRRMFRILGLDPADAWEWDKVAEGFTKAVEVKPVGGGVFELSCASGVPWMAQLVLTQFYEEAMDELRNASRDRFTTTLSSLGRAADAAALERRKAVADLARFNARNQSATSPGLFMQLSQLEVEAKIKEQKYLAARQELEMVRLQREKFSLPAIVLSPAVRPVRPSKPKWPKLLVAGFLAGVMSGMGFALWRGSRA
jgi:uncharacterized protein involved in exopolysaccharide biosynthesis